MSDTLVHDYRSLGLVGQGQFAQVYCAVHRRTGQVVAIKRTRHSQAQTSQESSILSLLNHPNVVGCYGVEQVDDNCCFILEYCESGTLRSYLNAFCPLPLTQAKSFLTQILTALSYVHNKKIVHGDLKPENILLAYRSNRLIAKLSDFGIASSIENIKETTNLSHYEIGSPTYAAPERFEGRLSRATDLYSVGVILYEILLGDRPFSGASQQLRRAHQLAPVPLPSTLSTAAAQLLNTALHKDPTQRFPTAKAMLNAVQHLPVTYDLDTYDSDAHSLRNIHATTRATTRATTLESKQTNVKRNSYGFLASFLQPYEKAKILQVLALSNRYLLRVRTSQQNHKTLLEGFTRRGQFIGQYIFNRELKHVALARLPYQIIGCLSALDTDLPAAVIIALKPFQIRWLPCDSQPCCACATDWGYAVACTHTIHFFDRSNHLVGTVENTLEVSEIAALKPRQILLTTPKSKASSHHILELDQLCLDIIF